MVKSNVKLGEKDKLETKMLLRFLNCVSKYLIEVVENDAPPEYSKKNHVFGNPPTEIVGTLIPANR
ncbi:17367_t:CDS:1, partial [Cetraspora pellucida]